MNAVSHQSDNDKYSPALIVWAQRRHSTDKAATDEGKKLVGEAHGKFRL